MTGLPSRSGAVPRPIDRRTLVGQLLDLGLRPGGLVEVHTAFRALRPVEGGPLGLIAALTEALGPAGTLVMPAMSDGASVFDPHHTPTLDMGITAELFRSLPDVVRSTHPGGSFAARGPLAEVICGPQPLEPVHGPDSPPGRVAALGGQVLLLGVGHDANTVVHVAEVQAGVPYAVRHPCVVVIGGAPRTVLIPEPDHCCVGFARLDGPLRARGAQSEGPVGYGHARLAEAAAVVEEALALLAGDPLAFLCAAGACEDCDGARASISGSSR